MQMFLDGNDWKVQYFISQQEVNTRNTPHVKNMFMDTARSARFILAEEDPQGYLPATIPGCDRSILLENGEIDDPYYGRNADRSRWPEQYEWAYRKEFTLPEEWKSCRTITLKLHSAGYKAVAFLNNEYLGERTGMFAAWEYDVSREIKREGKNVLSLIFEPAPKASPDHSSVVPAEFAYFHYCQMSFGWDWARTVVPTGIFDHVELLGSEVSRVRDCGFFTQGKSVKLALELGTLEDCTQDLTCTLEPLNFTGKSLTLKRTVELTAGKVNTLDWEFDFPEAELWYPNGYGEQKLYTLTLTMPGDKFTRQVGFRDLEMLRNPGSCEESYPLTFSINSKKVFARGLNWVPADMIFSRTDAALYEREVRLAKEAGFNLFRIWGGGIIEKDEFYAACDRHGILVWQEFPHACSQYPDNPRYLAEKTVEGEAIVRKLRNHVSMAMYCGGNEVLYYGEIPFHPLYKNYEALVNKLAPGMPYHISSPDQSRPGERDHGPWSYSSHKFWNAHKRLLASELGCPGWAELESLAKFIPENEPCPDGQSYHFHFSQCKPMAGHYQNFQPENTRRDMCYMNMYIQADQLEYAMGHYRKLFPEASGCYIWQYNESWPTNAYSFLDFYTRPKMAYYTISHSNKAVMAFLEDDSWCLADGKYNGKLYCISDHTEVRNVAVEFKALDITDKELYSKTFKNSYPQGTSEIGSVEFALADGMPDNVVILKYSIIAEDKSVLWDHERVYGVPDMSKILHTGTTSLQYTSSVSNLADGEKLLTVTVENTGSHAALFVRADLPENELYTVYWLDNYRLIEPGKKRTFQAKLTAGTTPGKITLRGWNTL